MGIAILCAGKYPRNSVSARLVAVKVRRVKGALDENFCGLGFGVAGHLLGSVRATVAVVIASMISNRRFSFGSYIYSFTLTLVVIAKG